MEENNETEHGEENAFNESEEVGKGRNSKIWELHLAGWSQEHIGARFNITQGRVSQILKQIRESIPEATREELITTEVERLDYALGKTVEVLERPHVVVTPSGRVAHEIVEYARDEDGNILLDKHGNFIPKKVRKVMDDGPILQAVDRLVLIGKERRKIFGLDAATRTEVSGPGGDPIAVQVQEFSSLPAEARRERLVSLQEEVQRRLRAAQDTEDDEDA